MNKPVVTWDQAASVLRYEREVVPLATASLDAYPRRLTQTTSSLMLCVLEAACDGRGATVAELKKSGTASSDLANIAGTIRDAVKALEAPGLAALIRSSRGLACVQLMSVVVISTAWGTGRYRLRLEDEQAVLHISLQIGGVVAHAAERAAAQALAAPGGHLGSAPSAQEQAVNFETQDGTEWRLTPTDWPLEEAPPSDASARAASSKRWVFDVVRVDRQSPSVPGLDQLARELCEANDPP